MRPVKMGITKWISEFKSESLECAYGSPAVLRFVLVSTLGHVFKLWKRFIPNVKAITNRTISPIINTVEPEYKILTRAGQNHQ